MAIVCSTWALGWPSSVTTVQPSDKYLRVVRPQINHRLDRKNVASLDFRPLPGLPIVRNLRVFVHPAANSMTDVIPHHRIAVALRVLLHRPANVTQVLSRPTLLNRQLQTLLGDPNQLQPVSLTVPTGTVVAVSPTKPSSVTPQSIEKMSPSFSL